jgi:FlaA1/EpsC-like NDP-sugar epimerase
MGQAAVDGASWIGSLVSAAWIRYDFTLSSSHARTILVAAAIAILLQNAAGHPLFLYRGRYAFGGFEEVRAVSSAVAATTFVLFTGNLLCPHRPLPASTPLTSGALALVGMLAVRYVRRLERERSMRPNPSGATAVLVFGAGADGIDLVRTMLRDPAGKYLPVGLIDDDHRKRNLRVNGIPVMGGRAALPDAVARTGASAVVFAVPSAPPALVREVRRLATDAGVTTKVIPSINSLLDRRVAVTDIRDLDVTDLLGRGQVETDVSAIAGYLRGRRVLVTGAGGSIGSELCRQIHRYSPAELIMLDHDESALHAVQLSIWGRALLYGPEVVLADLRDARRIRTVFAERQPQVVFHAAALKHQPLLEQHPAEAIKTNVWGTTTVLEAANRCGVEVLVNISTDKAADPCSVLGYSKRVAERLTAHMSRGATGRYLSVRFGNVLGSRGSVLTTFAAQIAAGGPITVTDKRMTRYFMTVQEAVQLVIQAGAVGQPGEALVLDMGEPVTITELAQQMAAIANEPIDIVYTGLRAGEKLQESLLGTGERGTRPSHPLISHVAVPPLNPNLTLSIDVDSDHDTVISQLISLCSAGHTADAYPRAASPAAARLYLGGVPCHQTIFFNL